MLQRFNQYNLVTELAKKYSHSTYLAFPLEKPEYQVVLTVFASSLFHFPHEYEDLQQKTQCIKKLQHKHLTPILDMGIEKKQPFVVREYLSNGSLRNRLSETSSRRLELSEALNIVLQVGEALAYVHEYNVIHGNIKPENILFDGSGQTVLTDFFLVSRKDAIIRDQTVEEYAFCYMAPEQFEDVCDARSDQYALGCVAYELITGQVPFAAQNIVPTLGRPSYALPIPLSERVADLPPSLEIAVLKTLARDPDERFFDFPLFLEVVRSVLSPPPAFPISRYSHSHKEKTPSHPVRSAEAILSPVRQHAAKRKVKHDAPSPFALQPAELAGASSNTELETAEPTLVFPVSDASISEWAEKTPLSEPLASVLDLTSELTTTTSTPEHATIDLLFTNAVLEEQMDISPVVVSANSAGWQSEDAVVEISSAFMGSTVAYRLQHVLTQHSKSKVLQLMLLVSVIIAVIPSAFWLSGMFASDTNLRPTNITTDNQAANLMANVVTPMVNAGVTPAVTPKVTPMANVRMTSTANGVTPTTNARMTPTATPKVTPTATPNAMQTTTVDDSIQGTGTNQFNYVGSGWLHCTNCGGDLYDSDNSWDGTTNDYVTITFTGSQIRFYGVLDTRQGIGAVSIDGGSETMIDEYATARAGNHLLWTSPVLPAGTHTFKFRVTGSKNAQSANVNVVIDRVDILS